MAANIFARYVWLIDLIHRNKQMTFEQISDQWKLCPLGDGSSLPIRTFHNHRKAIEEIFDVIIDCDTKSGYTYYIFNPEYLENDSLRSWLIDSFATLNQVQADRSLENRIQYENIPSGHKYLTQILEAIRQNRVVAITYQGFGKAYSSNFSIEPYYAKVYHRRWYVIARSPYDGVVRTYALDRVLDMNMTNDTYAVPETFNIDDYFDGCCGIIADKSKPIEKVVIKVTGAACDYVSTLPLHSSQKEIARDSNSITFEYHVRLTYEFEQAMFSQLEQIEVLEPLSLRQEIKKIAKNILNNYK